MQQPFDEVVQAHAGTVLRVCRAVLGAHEDAEDAWSETFLAALAAWPDLPDDVNAEAWLVRVAHRKAIDVVRGRQRRAVPVAEPPEHASTHGVPDGDGVWAEVARLPDRQRLSIGYHYFGGLPYAEVAELIGGTPEAARRAAADGLKTLRRLHESDGAVPRAAPRGGPR